MNVLVILAFVLFAVYALWRELYVGRVREVRLRGDVVLHPRTEYRKSKRLEVAENVYVRRINSPYALWGIYLVKYDGWEYFVTDDMLTKRETPSW